MKPEYLKERHNASGESIVDYIVDPIIDATVDDPVLRECLKAVGYAITGGIDHTDPAVRKCLKELISNSTQRNTCLYSLLMPASPYCDKG